jgi:RNA polymerase sigma factor (sigma-70 family)
LLERFARHHDEGAFEALVERHGAMVLGVCQRVLHDHHAAEDVFQATFLVLARKAEAIRRPESVGSWLFGVAYRLARRAQVEAAKRRRQERRPRPISDEDPTAELTWREVQQILDEELHQLPERLRIPLVLCYLEGKTHAEAAAQLGWSKGTLRRRLERGQTLLRARLLRRDPTLATNPLAVALAAPLAVPALPVSLVRPTTRAAMRFVAGPSAVQEAIAPRVMALAEGAWPTMWAAKLTMFAVTLLLTVGLVAAGMSLVGWPGTPVDSVSGAPEMSAADQRNNDDQGPRTDRHGDALPPGALLRLGTVRFREKEAMIGVAFAPDGKVLVSACSDGSLHLWDPATGKSVGQIKAPKDNLLGFAFSPDLLGFAFSPDGKLLAATAEKAVYLWDVAARKELHRIPCEIQSKDQGAASGQWRAPLGFSPDGRLLASAASDRTVHVWEVATGKERLRLGPHAKEVDCLAFTPDSKRLISAMGGRVADGKVYFWEVATGKEVRQIPIPARLKYPTTSPFAISPDGNTLAVEGLEPIMRKNASGVMTVSMGSRIRLIDLARGEERLQLALQPSVIWSAIFAPDSKAIALATMDHTITLRDTATGKLRHRFHGYPGGINPHGIQTLAFAPDGRTLASVESGTAIHLWDLTTGRELRHESEAHDSAITRVVYSRDGPTIASAGRDNSICLWDAATGRLRVKVKGHTDPADALAFSPDGTILASAAADETVRLWNVATGKELHRFAIPSLPNRHGTYTPVYLSLAFTAAGKALAVVGRDLKFRLLDVATGKELRQRPIHVTRSPKKLADYDNPSPTYRVALSPDGRTAALWNLDTVYLVDTATGQELLQLSTDGYPTDLAFSPDGQTLLTAGWLRTRRSLVWELATGKVALKIGGFDWITDRCAKRLSFLDRQSSLGKEGLNQMGLLS